MQRRLGCAAAGRSGRGGHAPRNEYAGACRAGEALYRRAWRPFTGTNILINAAKPIVRLVTHLMFPRTACRRRTPTGAF